MVLKAMEAGLKAKFAELPPFRRWVLNRLIGINRKLTAGKPRPALSRRLLPQIHQALGGELVAFITGGAFADPKTLQFFYDLGLPVANGYGLTEAGTAVTVNDLSPFAPTRWASLCREWRSRCSTRMPMGWAKSPSGARH